MSSEDYKRQAAEHALAWVEPGMRLGLGTGSTAACFVEALGRRVAAGLDVVGVPTSEATGRLAAECGIPLTTLDETPELDLTVDGADELDAGRRLIKGGGGALLREKIVATASARMVVVADRGKFVARLGAFPLPVEVVPFGREATVRAIARAVSKLGMSADTELRRVNGAPFYSDNGNLILDCGFGAIPEPDNLAAALSVVPGVVDHGLFIGICTTAIVAGPDGIDVLGEGEEGAARR